MRLVILLALVACEAAPSLPEDSNVFRRDYIGPEACGECHADKYAQWAGSLHRVMNARADSGSVIGEFSGQAIAYAGGTVQFGPGYAMTLRKDGAERRYLVTRTIGRHGLQEYVGTDGGAEVRLPFGWWPRAGGWSPQPAFDPWLDEGKFDAYAPITQPWAARCPWCHSTYPFAQRIARSDTFGVGHGHEQAATLDAPGNDPSVPRRSGRGTETPYTATLALDEQVTVGISCESCHLGGRVHAAGGPIHLVPHGVASSALPDEPFAAERRDARIVNETCAQCHSGPSPRLADGTALRNSSEALDLAASPCSGIKCTDCHDPHAGGSDEARAIATCTRCHTATAATHGHHDGATCLDCHMPRVVMGLDHFVRTHRISSPTDPRVLPTGPNACNLCHLDRSLRWTLAQLADGWDARPRVAADDTAMGERWIAGKPALRLMALAAYARRPDLVRPAPPPDTRAYVRAWEALLNN